MSETDHPARGHHPTRRRVLVAGASVAAAAPVLAACGPNTRERQADALQPLLDAARAEADLFSAADVRQGTYDRRIRSIGDVRRRHAERITAEIARLDPSSTVAPAPPGGPMPVCPPVEEVRGRLRASARAAASTAGGLDGYRASLAASVSAACACAAEVVLA